MLRDATDPHLVPVRVVWLARRRNGQRSVRWKDLLTFGDPRDPDPIRQRFVLRSQPDRCRIVVGRSARVSQLRERWQDRTEGGSAERFADFVDLQAALALEREERALRGGRYKVPRFVSSDLLGRGHVRQGITALATELNRPSEAVESEVRSDLTEIAATHSPYMIDLVAHATRLLISKAYGENLHYDKEHLRSIYELAERHSLVFLPSHKSHIDHLALQLVLYENDLPPNHTAGGINLNFFPVGPLVRRAGVFFIRRSFKDNPIYKFTLRSYIRYLLEKRFPLEWYIEGGRSRSGKLRPPRFGMLSYVVDGFHAADIEDVVLVPVAIAYDQIQDVADYAAEQAGKAKRAENVARLVEFVRSLRRSHGSIHLRFGRPISLAEEAAYADGDDPDDVGLDVKKIAFEVAARINEVTPITPISLVTLAHLGAHGRALTIDETMTALRPHLAYVVARNLPTTADHDLADPNGVRDALDDLAVHRVVERLSDGTGPDLYRIGPEQALAASYYRNTIIHFFVTSAICEVALAAAAVAEDPKETFWDQVMELRDLLKFEFFFPRKSDFRADVEREMDLKEPAWREMLGKGEVGMLLAGFQPALAPTVLEPFFEAYLVYAETLAAAGDDTVDTGELVERALGRGRRYLWQGRISGAEAVSAELFKSAASLADNRGLGAAGTGVARRRFATELATVYERTRRMEPDYES